MSVSAGWRSIGATHDGGGDVEDSFESAPYGSDRTRGGATGRRSRNYAELGGRASGQLPRLVGAGTPVASSSDLISGTRSIIQAINEIRDIQNTSADKEVYLNVQNRLDKLERAIGRLNRQTSGG